MYTEDCIYCERKALSYDLAGATQLNSMQAQVIEQLLVERDFYATQAERLRAGLEGLRQRHHRYSPYDYGVGMEPCPLKMTEAEREDLWWTPTDGVWRCACGAEEHNARIDALLEAAT